MKMDKKKIAVIDYETDPFKYGRIPKAFACGFYDGTTYERIFNNSENRVLRWASDRVKMFDGIVYAHNGGKFDFIGFLFRSQSGILRGEKIELRGNRIVRCQFGNAELRDSYAILPAPLKAHDKGEIDYEKFELDRRGKYKTEILEYLRRDCISLHGLVSRFLETHGTRHLTAASAAMAHLHEECGYEVERLSENDDKKFREWYFGGRVQNFKSGAFRGNFKVYDVKSAYPHAMSHPHAVSSRFDFLTTRREWHEIRATDFILYDGVSRGALPSRTKDGISFPPAKSTWRITGHEFLAAEKMGLITGKILFVERPRKTDCFTRYVDHWFAEKERCEKQGDTAGRLIAKIMLNSAYGKFAQNPEKYREYYFGAVRDILSPKDIADGWREEMCDEKNGYTVFSCPTRRPAIFYNCATASSITGFVRAILLEAIHNENPYYCDTDSVILDHEMQTGEGLGSWQLETEGDLLYIAGKKLYALRILKGKCPNSIDAEKSGYYWDGQRAWKIASKGCKMTPQEMAIVASGGTVQTFNQAPTYSIKSGTKFISRRIRKI